MTTTATLARRLFWGMTRRKGWLAGGINAACALYRSAYADVSYDIAENGEAALLRAFSELRPSVIFDVGANRGDWCREALKAFPQASIHAFELSPSTYAALAENLKGTTAILNPAGLSDRSGSVEFRDFGDGSALSTLVSTDFHSAIPFAITVGRIVSGDEYCSERGISRIDLLKVDVEGAELRVLRGFERMLDRRQIRCIQFEYGYANGDDHALMRDFHALLGAHGYVLGRLNSLGVSFGPFTYDQNLFTSGPNYVAVFREDEVCLRTLTEFSGASGNRVG